MLEMKVFNSSSSYHLLLVHGRKKKKHDPSLSNMDYDENLRGRSRSWDQALPQVEFVYNNTVRDSKDVQEEVQLKIEKTNKKYKTMADKKRQEKLFKEEDIMMAYLREKRIPIERVPIEKLNPDSKTSSFEEGGTDVGRELRQHVNFEPQLSTTNISCR